MSSEPLLDADVLVEVKDLVKTYRVWEKPIDRLKYAILDRLSVSGREKLFKPVYALRPFSLSLKRGEAVGIVGRNGSGKSTLLQIIAGSLKQSSGSMQKQGKIAALLELGSGFNPEFTGVENIRTYATVLGLEEEQIDAKMSSIIDYADIGDFVYQPVKTYSSGMQMRLAFAVAAHVDADVIIIDEALGVGDARFQLKCAGTIDAHLAKGRALLFVSHDLNSVKRLCDRAVLLEAGEKLMEGDPNQIANVYTRIVAGDTLEEVREHIAELAKGGDDEAFDLGMASDIASIGAQKADGPLRELSPIEEERDALKLKLAALMEEPGADLAKRLLKKSRLEKQNYSGEFVYGGDIGQIENIQILDASGNDCLVFPTGDAFEVRFEATSKERIETPIYAMTVKDTKGQDLYICNTLYRKQSAPPLDVGEKHYVTFRQQMNLMPGEYFISLGFVSFVGQDFLVLHRRYDALRVQALPVDRCHGIANLYTEISVSTTEQID